MNSPAQGRRRGVRIGLISALVILVLILALVVDYAVLAARPGSIAVTMPPTQQGTTWVIVGLDDRSTVAEQTKQDVGTKKGAPVGARADIIIVVHQTPDGLKAFTVSRDVLVRTADDVPNRLANTWLASPQNFVDSLCRSVGIPATHLVSVNMRALVSLVDALGGVEVAVPQALRDAKTGINLPAGSQHLDGRTALGLARSRQGQVYSGGKWIADPQGPTGRQQRASLVLQATMAKAKGSGPVALQTAAWRTLPDVAMSPDASLFSLRVLADLPTPAPLPVKENAAAALAELTPASTKALAQAGYSGECTPA